MRMGMLSEKTWRFPGRSKCGAGAELSSFIPTQVKIMRGTSAMTTAHLSVGMRRPGRALTTQFEWVPKSFVHSTEIRNGMWYGPYWCNNSSLTTRRHGLLPAGQRTSARPSQRIRSISLLDQIQEIFSRSKDLIAGQIKMGAEFKV